MKNKKKVLYKLLDLAPLFLLIVLWLGFACFDARLLLPGNILQIVVQATPIAIVSVGLMLVLICGGMDMSAGYGIAMCAVVFGRVYSKTGNNLLLGILAAVLAGVLLGVANGVFVGAFDIPPFIVTLATMSVAQGITLLLTSTQVIMLNDPILKAIGSGKTLGIPNAVLYAGVICTFMSFVIKKSRFGLRAYAMGSNVVSSTVTGVPILKQWLLVYMFSGISVALTAILLLSRTSLVSANVGGISVLLDAVIATVAGGTSVYGGKGTIVGTLLGAVLVSFITYALTIFNVNPQTVDVYKGIIIIAVLALDTAIRHSQKRIEGAKA